MGVTYRGVHSDEFGLIVRTNPMILPEHENTLIPIPGMHGAHDGGSEYDVGRIHLEISFIANDIYDYSDRLRRLANWLRPDEGVGEYIADHEPDKTYFAKLASTSMSRIELIARMGEGTIELICPDPFAYGREQSQSLVSTIANEGTMDAYPVFDLTVTRDTELISIENRSSQNRYGDSRGIYIGTDVEVDEEVKERKSLILHDAMQSTSGWTGASNVDSGTVTGTMGTDKNGFYVEDWGDEDDGEKGSQWIGPSLQRSLSRPVDSFQADMLIANRNEYNADGIKERAGVGIMEFYFRDVNDNLICKMAFGDSYGSAKAENSGKLTVGNKSSGKIIWKPSGYNDFNGMVRVTRDSGVFYGYIASMTGDGRHYKIQEVGPITPDSSVIEHEVSKIQVAIRKYVGASRIWQRIKEIKIWDVVGTYEYPDSKKVEKFEPGDKIRIDTGTGEVTLNGEPRTDLVQLDSEFFSLVEGINQLDISDNVEGTITHRNRYL